MLNLFKKASEKDKLNKKYQKLISEAHKLSHTDRKASDAKMAEAEEVAKKMDQLED